MPRFLASEVVVLVFCNSVLVENRPAAQRVGAPDAVLLAGRTVGPTCSQNGLLLR